MSDGTDPRVALLEELRAYADEGATALDEVGAVLDALIARAGGFGGDGDPDQPSRFDLDAIWTRVALALGSRP